MSVLRAVVSSQWSVTSKSRKKGKAMGKDGRMEEGKNGRMEETEF